MRSFFIISAGYSEDEWNQRTMRSRVTIKDIGGGFFLLG